MENLKIEWQHNPLKKCLKFTFNEKLGEQNATAAIEKWRKSFNTYPGEKVVLIWDCLNMAGYESGARNQWQNTMKELKEQIDSIWLITNSSLIKMGASVMAVFASYPIKVVSSEKNILIK